MQQHPRTTVLRLLMREAGLTEPEAREVEIGVYNWSLRFADDHLVTKAWRCNRFAAIYIHKSRSVIANLDPASPLGNTRLLARMREGEFAPHDIASMRPEHLFPDRWKEALDRKIQKDEYVYNEKPAAMTDQFRCARCKKRECVYQELQLRSCDEPVSLFITCLNCGNRWRIG